MKPAFNLKSIALCAVLAACSNDPQYVEVFADLNHKDRVWEDQNGVIYSALQDSEGTLIVHNTQSGMMYRYRNWGGALTARPKNAPLPKYVDGKISLGDTTLTPADMIVEEITFTSGGQEF